MSGRKAGHEIGKIDAVETGAHAEQGDVDVRFVRDRPLARPGIEQHV